MTIANADILTEVNDNLEISLTDIDKYIQKVLDDLSEEDLLVGSETGTLESGATTLDEPDGYRAMVAITLTLNSSEKWPLIKLPGGHRQYRQLRHNDDSTGIPEYYSRFNGKFYLWRPANQEFTTLIEYYKNHPQDVGNIEFDDINRNAIYAGATFYTALKYNRTSALSTWGPMYHAAKQKRIDSTVFQARICRG